MVHELLLWYVSRQPSAIRTMKHAERFESTRNSKQTRFSLSSLLDGCLWVRRHSCCCCFFFHLWQQCLFLVFHSSEIQVPRWSRVLLKPSNALYIHNISNFFLAVGCFYDHLPNRTKSYGK